MPKVPAGHPEKPEGEEGLKLLERMNGGRHEELAQWALSFLSVNDADRILDIGCGGGANVGRLLDRAPSGIVVGVDYSPASVRVSKDYNAVAIEAGRCSILEGNSSSLTLSDRQFDLVTAFETVYYWDIPVAFREVKRVLKPKGRFLVCNEDDGSDPAALALAQNIPGMVVYTPTKLEAELCAAGFDIVRTERIPEKGFLAIVAQA